jgi:uncharacterized RDD family membrane protein YckC
VGPQRAGIALRGVAACIDLLAVYLLLYVLAAITGNTIEGGGFKLTGAPFLIGVAVSLGYFIAMEAMLGATLGKLATQLVVVMAADGAPIGWRSAILRNLLRLIDGFVLYAIGLAAICVTSKRQRLGDLAAGTMVVRRASRGILTERPVH